MGAAWCQNRRKQPPNEDVEALEVDRAVLLRYLRQKGLNADVESQGTTEEHPAKKIARQLPSLKDFKEFQRDERETKGKLKKELLKRPFWEVFREPFVHFKGKFVAGVKHQGLKMFILKWGVPAFVNAACLFTCMLLLHIATFYYVREMLANERNYEVKPHAEFKGWIFSQGEKSSDVSFGSLNDPVETWLGYKDISIESLDKIAMVFPMCFMMTVLLLMELRTWTKILLCNSLLAVGKGLLGAMTTVPDSNGWAACKERLDHKGAEGMAFFEHHGLGDLLSMELFGSPDSHKHLRFCADMMYSGHTYMTCLYALGLYELIRIWFSKVRHGFGRIAPLIFVVALAVGEQTLEVYCVLKSHFHYSSDVFGAIAVTLLVYTNSAVSIAAKRWAQLGFDPLSAEARAHAIHSLGGDEKDVQDFSFGDGLESFRSGGDVLIPPCCVPFCCLTGREHMFNDKEIETILRMVGDEDDLSRYFLRLELRIGEGVRAKDWQTTLASSGLTSLRRDVLTFPEEPERRPSASAMAPYQNNMVDSFSSSSRRAPYLNTVSGGHQLRAPLVHQ